MEGPVKTIATFAAGALVAAGVAFFVTSRNHEAPAPGALQVQQQTAPVEPAPTAMPAATEVQTAITQPDPTPKQGGWKPSAAPKSTTKVVTPPAVTAPVQTTPPTQTAQATQPPAPISTPAAVLPPEPAPMPPPPPKRVPKTITIPAGTLVTVRIDQTLDTKKNQSGDNFAASLDQPLVIDGMVIAERGARAEGHVILADEGGRVKGLAELKLELVRLTTADGQKVKLQTASFTSTAKKETGKDVAKVGAAAGIGAAIGAIAGGGKGAGLGAIIGGAAGTGGVMATRGASAQIPAETRISFKLSESISLTERLN